MTETMPNIDPAAVALFLRAAETSFARAADAMNLSRSAVTQTIERLEKSWGVALFDRASRPMRLTAEGEAAAALARRYLAESQVFADGVAGLARRKVPSLRLVISEVARAFAGAEIEAALIPTVTAFSAETGLIPAVQKRFAEGKADLAVAPDLPEAERLLARRLCTERYCLVTPQSSAPVDGMLLSEVLPKLALPFVSYRRESLDWQKAQRLLRILGLPAGRTIALENTQAVAEAVASGLGWTILPLMNLWCVRERLSGVTLHSLGEATAEKTLWAAVKDARFLPAMETAASVFRKCLQTKWRKEMLAAKPAAEDFMSF